MARQVISEKDVRMRREGEWQELIASLREKHKSLRAFQDELNKAKLQEKAPLPQQTGEGVKTTIALSRDRAHAGCKRRWSPFR